MTFCSYCECEDCRTGVIHCVDFDGHTVEYKGPPLRHALTEWGNWVCEVCHRYGFCKDWQKACGEPIDPCPPGHCGHRPRLVGTFVVEG